uniref:Col_cuticle_N domain-containing protein n=1 Tax=Steinernema glaseri TaxID=37863 RepID=A0A1I7YXZ9_9BILA
MASNSVEVSNSALHDFSEVFAASTACIDTLLTRVFILVGILIVILVTLIFIAFLSLKNVWHRLQKTVSDRKEEK